MHHHHKTSKVWGDLIIGDILDKHLLNDTFEKYKPTIVIHLANYVDIFESLIYPDKYYNNNLEGSINVLNAVKKSGVKHFIFASSCAVYGSNNLEKNKEQDLLYPQSPYAFIKYSVERLIEDYAKAYNFNYLNLRYFNVAGLDETVDFKRSDKTHLGLIPLALNSKNRPFPIFGHNYPTADHTAICDYIHVKDVAFAHLLSCKYLLDNKPSQTINIGSGIGHSVLEVLKTLELITNTKIEYCFEKQKYDSSPFTVADITKAEKILGFIPQHSSISEIIKSETSQ